MVASMFQYSNSIIVPEAVEAFVEKDGSLALSFGPTSGKLVVGRLPFHVWFFNYLGFGNHRSPVVNIDNVLANAVTTFQTQALEKLRESLPQIDGKQCVIVIAICVQNLRAVGEGGSPDLAVGNQILNFIPKLLAESPVFGQEDAALAPNKGSVSLEELGVIGGCSEFLVAEAGKNGIVVDFLLWGFATIYWIGLTKPEAFRDFMKDVQTSLKVGAQQPALIAMVDNDRGVVDKDFAFVYVVTDSASVEPAT